MRLYTALLLDLEALERVLRTPLAADPELRAGEIRDAVGIGVGNVNRSYLVVDLGGSPDILPLAEAAWKAAWALFDWASARPPEPVQALVELEILRIGLSAAANAFAEAIRNQTAR